MPESEVYDALNMYYNFGRKPELKAHYENVYANYVKSGGKLSLEYFINNLDAYNIQGHCGY